MNVWVHVHIACMVAWGWHQVSFNKHSIESGSLAEPKACQFQPFVSLSPKYWKYRGHHAWSTFVTLRFWTPIFMIDWEGHDVLSDFPQDARVSLFILSDFFFSLHFCLLLKASKGRDCMPMLWEKCLTDVKDRGVKSVSWDLIRKRTSWPVRWRGQTTLGQEAGQKQETAGQVQGQTAEQEMNRHSWRPCL